ncbi:SRPBCC family protein [Lutibaculum baratangense]|nr:SRPBCC family protein [Lutibaculum baratangense]
MTESLFPDAKAPDSDTRELKLVRLMDAPREKIFRAWTTPELLKPWFCPAPWRVSHAELDVRPGGSNLIVMNGPDGEEFPNRGVYLEVVPNEKLVFTDAYTEAWVPSGKPFFTGIILLEDEGGKTRYTAIARHWSEEDRKAHEEMGFHEGWGKVAEQLEDFVRQMPD